MIKVLYVGVFLDGTGWANMAINTMLAMDSVGIDVVGRALKLNTSRPLVPDKIIDMAKKPGGKFDAVIQNILPRDLEFTGKIPLNIAYYYTETSSVSDVNRINLLDQSWVANDYSSHVARTNGVNHPINVIPIAANVSKYTRNYKPLSIRHRMGDSFVFYYIGDFNKRKNIGAIIRAFHLEFDVSEPVELLIKTDIATNADSVKKREIAHNEIAKVKSNMQLYPSLSHYKNEIILVGNYSDEEILRLHTTCDCFICPSYGEAWSIPAFDAMALGKTPIVSNHGGFLQYLDEDSAYLVNGRLEPAFGFLSSREQCFSVDINHLRQQMRLAYENRDLRLAKSSAGRQRAFEFSYEKVGRKIYESLMAV